MAAKILQFRGPEVEAQVGAVEYPAPRGRMEGTIIEVQKATAARQDELAFQLTKDQVLDEYGVLVRDINSLDAEERTERRKAIALVDMFARDHQADPIMMTRLADALHGVENYELQYILNLRTAYARLAHATSDEERFTIARQIDAIIQGGRQALLARLPEETPVEERQARERSFRLHSSEENAQRIAQNAERIAAAYTRRTEGQAEPQRPVRTADEEIEDELAQVEKVEKQTPAAAAQARVQAVRTAVRRGDPEAAVEAFDDLTETEKELEAVGVVESAVNAGRSDLVQQMYNNNPKQRPVIVTALIASLGAAGNVAFSELEAAIYDGIVPTWYKQQRAA